MRAWFNCTHLFGSPLALTYGARLYQLKVSEWPSWHEALALRLSTGPGISSVPPSVATNLQYYNSSKRNRYSYNTGFCSSVLCYWHLQIVFLLVVIIYCMYSPVPLPQIHHFGTPWPLPETAPPSLHLLYHLIVQDHMVVHIHWTGPLDLSIHLTPIILCKILMMMSLSVAGHLILWRELCMDYYQLPLISLTFSFIYAIWFFTVISELLVPIEHCTLWSLTC